MVGEEKLKWCQLAHHQLMRQARTFCSPHSTPTTNDKSANLGRMVSNVISDVATASVYSEKTHLKKLTMMMKMIFIIIIIIIMNKSQETTDFRGSQKLTSAMKLRPEK